MFEVTNGFGCCDPKELEKFVAHAVCFVLGKEAKNLNGTSSKKLNVSFVAHTYQ